MVKHVRKIESDLLTPLCAPPGNAVASFAQASNDIICDVLSRVIAMAPGFSPALAEQIDRDTRQVWGGDRPYISSRKGAGSSSRNDQIKRDYQNGERVALLERRYGLSGQQIRNIVKT